MTTPANHIAKPSSARKVSLDSFVPVPRGSTAVAPPPLNWPAKDPGDVLDYQLDIGSALIGNDGDAIATLDVAVSPSNPGDLVVGNSEVDGPRVVLWISGGQVNTIYTITINITTMNGRALQRSVLLPVLPLSAPPVPATAIATDLGLIITDQNGNPVLAG